MVTLEATAPSGGVAEVIMGVFRRRRDDATLGRALQRAQQLALAGDGQAAFLIGLAIAWFLFNASRRTKVTGERQDVLDEGAAPAARNQACCHVNFLGANLQEQLQQVGDQRPILSKAWLSRSPIRHLIAR